MLYNHVFRNMIRKRFHQFTTIMALLILVICLLLVLVNCASSSDDPTDADIADQFTLTTAPAESQTEDITHQDEIIPVSNVKIEPDFLSIDVGGTKGFHAQAIDINGNIITDAQIEWEIPANIGKMSKELIFSAGTQAGVYIDSIVALATIDNMTIQATASVTINPGPPVKIEISESIIQAGKTTQLTVLAVDQYNNSIGDLDGNWRILDQNVGALTNDGFLTAGQVAGVFNNAVTVEVKNGEEIQTGTASITI